MRLSTTQLETAQTLAKTIFEWERLCEEHCAVLRCDPNQMAEVYMEYERHAPPAGTLPPREQWDLCLREIGSTVGEEVVTFADRLKTVNACALLSRLSIMKAAEEDNDMFLEMLRIKDRLHREHPYEIVHMRLPADIHPYLAQQLAQAPATVSPSPSSNDPPSSKYPSVLPAQSFTSESVQNLYRTPVTPEDVAAYRRNPDLLLSQSFLTSDNEYIQVSSMITTGRGETKESLSYVAFADDGPEAYCHPLESLLKLLEGSYILN